MSKWSPLVLLSILFIPGLTVAQIPDEFENLKLLPQDIDKGQLVATMRDWAGGLGVRCNYCHLGPDNLVGMDFSTDEKATKRTARKMLEVARRINRELLADLPTVAEGQQHQVVSCFTCHRGMTTPPRDIRVALGQVADSEGVEAAISEYRKLRQEHFGAGKYDFSERGLLGIAQGLVEGGEPLDAVSLLEMGLEYYPQSADLHAVMAMTYVATGELAQAGSALQAALELDPDNRMAGFAKQQLDDAKKQ
jgi:hypothetical protein